MATTTDVYKLIVETTEATNAISDFAKGVGVAFTGMVGVVAAFADEIADTAQAFGATTASVLSLSAALDAAGGKGDNAKKIFQGIASSIDELNSGNLQTLQNFKSLGITLGELGTMSESEIRDKVITNIGSMTNKTEAASTAMKFFGKAAVGVDFATLAQQIRDNTDESEKYGLAIQDAADAYDSMGKILRQVKVAFAEAFSPVFQMLGGIRIETQTIVSIFKTLTYVLVPVVTAVVAIRTAIMAATVAMTAFNAVTRANPILLGASLIISGVTAIGLAIAGNTKKQEENNNVVAENGDNLKINVVQTEELNKKIKQQAEELSKIVGDYRAQTNLISDQIQLAKQSLTISQTEQQIIQAKAEIERKLMADLAVQKQKFLQLDSESQKMQMQSYLRSTHQITKQADAQKELLSSRATMTTGVEQISRLELEIYNIYANRGVQMQKIAQQIKTMTMETDEKAKSDRESIGYFDQIARLQSEINSNTTLSLDQKTEYLSQLSKVRNEEQLVAVAMQLQQKNGINVLDVLNSMRDTTIEVGIEQDKLTKHANSFATGWTQAFNSYYESATNASKMANSQFSIVTRGMESIIDQFVNKGKVNFKDLSRSIIADLIKIELKASAMSLWKMMGGATSGGGGLLSSLGSFFGGFFADGGQPPVGKASVVGERGPELFVPKSAGTIIPNGAGLGGTVQNVINNNTYVTNNVSAVDAKSVAQLFSENRRTLLGATEQARKELPVRMRG